MSVRPLDELDADDTASERDGPLVGAVVGEPVSVPSAPSTPRSHRALDRARLLAGALALLAAAALAGLSLAEHARAARPIPTVEVRVGGEMITGDAEQAAAHIADAWEARPLVLELAGERIEGTRASMGAVVDRGALAASIAQARDARSLMRRFHDEERALEPIALPLPIVPSPEALARLLAERKDRLDTRAVDARIEPRTGRVVPETTGRYLDVFATLEAAYRAATDDAEHVEARIVARAPTRSAADLANVRVEAVLGAYETHYSTLEDARDRTYNLRVAASKVDGTVLMPGESFDFNEAVGERSEANGFRPAPEIAGGELVDGVGGGTCQIAGTLHAAAFFAGLPIVERSPHSRPSGYIWMGLDAVVVYQRFNLRFTNDLDTPVVIGMTVEGGTVRAELRGARAERMVTFTRRVDRVDPFTERSVPDPSLPTGVRVLRQRGVPGFAITRFRIVRDVAHNQARRQRWEDTYPPTEQIWRVGSGPPAPEGFVAPPGDAHPEYTTDELLSASFGAGISALEISRRAGRTGTPGWMARMGLPAATP